MSADPLETYPSVSPEAPEHQLALTEGVLGVIHGEVSSRAKLSATTETQPGLRQVLLRECATHLWQQDKINLRSDNMEDLLAMSLALISYDSLQVDAMVERDRAIDRIHPSTPAIEVNRFTLEEIRHDTKAHIRAFRSGRAKTGVPIWLQEQQEIKRLRGLIERPIPTIVSSDAASDSVPPYIRRGDAFPEIGLAKELFAATERPDTPVAHRALEIIVAMMGKNLPPPYLRS